VNWYFFKFSKNVINITFLRTYYTGKLIIMIYTEVIKLNNLDEFNSILFTCSAGLFPALHPVSWSVVERTKFMHSLLNLENTGSSSGIVIGKQCTSGLLLNKRPLSSQHLIE